MSKKKVLIVDDNEDLRDALTDILQYKKIESLAATNGKSGVALALSEHPDLILLDVRMPDIDGFEVMRQLRADKWGKNAQIMLLTASSTFETIPEDIVLPKEDFLMKTVWGIDNLARKVEERLANPLPEVASN